VLSPCYETVERALQDTEAVVRGWTLERPWNLRLLLSLREEEPFHLVLTAYDSPRAPGTRRMAWLSALVLRRQPCGWVWIDAVTIPRRRQASDTALVFEAAVNREWRFWVALGETATAVDAVACIYGDGTNTTVRPAEGAVLVGGRLRGPRRLDVLGGDGSLIETHPLPRALSIELPPRDGPLGGEVDVEASDRATVVSRDEDGEEHR
jgi:hypothetical protein